MQWFSMFGKSSKANLSLIKSVKQQTLDYYKFKKKC